MTTNETTPGDELTDRQLLAIPFIAAAPTQTESAATSRSILARRRQKPRFKSARSAGRGARASSPSPPNARVIPAKREPLHDRHSA